jgi:hypothetical protein
MAETPFVHPMTGDISEAARAKLLDRTRKLRILKYRLLFIFLLLPGLLVSAIVFDWVWDMNLSGRLTRDYVLAIYGGLVALLVVVFCTIGYMIRKRMRREDEETLKGPTPIDMASKPAVRPIVTKLKAAKSEGGRSRR